MAGRQEFVTGERIGRRYRIIQRIGAGGMGSVYEVEHTELGKRFALKALQAATGDADDLEQRMRLEWRSLARLTHPSVVSVSDAGVTEAGRPYYVMELLEGQTLGRLVRRRGALPIADALRLGAELLEGLAAAHAIGVVHRDVKPANLFVTRDGRMKVLDFGVAKILSGGAEAITGKGITVGTPRYMSPEQCSGRPVDARSDLYAAGLVLFEMVVGRGPFDGLDSEGVFLAHLTRPPPRLRDHVPAVPESLDELIDRLLAKSPEARPDDAGAVAGALRAILAEVPISAPRTVVRAGARGEHGTDPTEMASDQPIANMRAGLVADDPPSTRPADVVGLLERTTVKFPSSTTAAQSVQRAHETPPDGVAARAAARARRSVLPTAGSSSGTELYELDDSSEGRATHTAAEAPGHITSPPVSVSRPTPSGPGWREHPLVLWAMGFSLAVGAVVAVAVGMRGHAVPAAAAEHRASVPASPASVAGPLVAPPEPSDDRRQPPAAPSPETPSAPPLAEPVSEPVGGRRVEQAPIRVPVASRPRERPVAASPVAPRGVAPDPPTRSTVLPPAERVPPKARRPRAPAPAAARTGASSDRLRLPASGL